MATTYNNHKASWQKEVLVIVITGKPRWNGLAYMWDMITPHHRTLTTAHNNQSYFQASWPKEVLVIVRHGNHIWNGLAYMSDMATAHHRTLATVHSKHSYFQASWQKDMLVIVRHGKARWNGVGYMSDQVPDNSWQQPQLFPSKLTERGACNKQAWQLSRRNGLASMSDMATAHRAWWILPSLAAY